VAGSPYAAGMTLGERFAAALAAKDSDALREMLADDVDFKGLTPRKFWEASNPDEVLEVLFGSWFEDEDRIQRAASIDQGDDVGEVKRVGYRLEIDTPSGPHVVEQQVYYRDHEDKLDYLRVVCSGYQPTS
jgi:hypothetical protein